MKGVDLLRAGISNSLRSKTRTILTAVAIFIGAFTLTLTNGVGIGVNQYISDTVSSIGANNVMTVAHSAEVSGTGPREYDPSTTTVTGPQPGASSVDAITDADLEELRGVEGVVSADPVLAVTPDYVQHADGTRYQLSVGGLLAGTTLQLAAGQSPDRGSERYEIALPESYVEPMGFADAASAIGEDVSIGITDATGAQTTIAAVVVGIAEPGLLGGTAARTNEALTEALSTAQRVGVPASVAQTYPQATVRFQEDATPEAVSALQDRLTKLGYTGTTVDDQIGAFTTVIDAIVLILNAFAVIALLAASFGIVNTLLMSVQERTREIGLMKAMGMSGGRVFALFSIEAVFIGFLGSAIGAGVAMLVGLGANSLLAGGVLAALPGLSIVAFEPVSIAVIILIVMFIAFLAGTIPALRAAKADPIESLRYE